MTTTARFTIRDLDAFPDSEFYRYEIIDGELYVTKAPSGDHQVVCGNLIYEIGVWDRTAGLGVVMPAPGVVFADDDAAIPDLVWVRSDRYRRIVDSAGHFTAAPHLVVEVLSPGSGNQRRDREIKLALYTRRGVPEYWIVDQEAREVMVYRRQDDALTLIVTLGEGDTLTSPNLPGFASAVSSLFRGLPR